LRQDAGKGSKLVRARIGVLGGTFNPIHAGHVQLALSALDLFRFSRIHFVVAATPPHKPTVDLLPLPHRYAMVSLATAGHPRFLPSLIELDPPASPYSIDTMRKMARVEGCSPSSLLFIAGGDSLSEVGEWKESRKLLSTFGCVFVSRPGVPRIDPREVLPAAVHPRVWDLRGLSGGALSSAIRCGLDGDESRIVLIDAAARNVSSSDIRRRVSEGKRFRHLLPPAVFNYINKTGLYGDR
jgi:nicotinate-nucleotide adenylyltransferase